jgi:hypothetical protein
MGGTLSRFSLALCFFYPRLLNPNRFVDEALYCLPESRAAGLVTSLEEGR